MSYCVLWFSLVMHYIYFATFMAFCIVACLFAGFIHLFILSFCWQSNALGHREPSPSASSLFTANFHLVFRKCAENAIGYIKDAFNGLFEMQTHFQKASVWNSSSWIISAHFHSHCNLLLPFLWHLFCSIDAIHLNRRIWAALFVPLRLFLSINVKFIDLRVCKRVIECTRCERLFAAKRIRTNIYVNNNTLNRRLKNFWAWNTISNEPIYWTKLVAIKVV